MTDPNPLFAADGCIVIACYGNAKPADKHLASKNPSRTAASGSEYAVNARDWARRESWADSSRRRGNECAITRTSRSALHKRVGARLRWSG
jgi:hypothetical protein